MSSPSARPFILVPWSDDFLARIHALIEEVTDGSPGKAVVVFPLNRPKRYLIDIYRRNLSGPLLLPEILNVQQLARLCLESWEPMVPRQAGTLDQVAMLRESVLAVSRGEDADTALGKLAGQVAAEDGMARFFPWGVRLAQALEDCSNHLVKAVDFQHLEEEVAPFAAALLSGLRRIQEDYRERMQSRGMSTTAMDAQRAATLAANAPELPRKLHGKKLILAGFVRLTAAEERLFHYLWEKDAYICLNTDPELAAGRGHWSCADHREWIARWKAQVEIMGKAEEGAPHLHFIAGYDLHSQLKELRQELEKVPHTDERRAVVLSHDSLLMPTLHHIPQKDINISLGYPLKRSLLARLVERLLKLQERMDNEGRIYWKDLLGLIRHPYIRMLAAPSEAGQPQPLRPLLTSLEGALREGTRMVDLTPYLQQKNADAAAELMNTALRVLVADWRSVGTLRALAGCLRSLCEMLRHYGAHVWKNFPLDAECLTRLMQNVIPELCDNALADAPLSQATLFAVLRQAISEQRVAFEADPLTGLQVLGALETRLLRFERVYFLDLTEDALPGAPAQDPLLPDNLRRELGLPDTRRRDRLAAHTFYRLLAGAKEVFLYWQEGFAEGILDGKKARSRFVEELLWKEEQHQKTRLSPEVPSFSMPEPQECEAQSIERTPKINARMEKLLSRGLYPSQLDTYLSCPAKFFYQYLCNIQTLQEVQEEDDAAGVGSLLHQVLQSAYEPFVGRAVRKGDISPEALEALFQKKLKESGLANTLPAQSRFMLEAAAPLRLRAFLENQPEECALLQVEHTCTAFLPLGERRFKLKGKLDRLDKRGEGFVVLDYKTGRLDGQIPKTDFWTDTTFWEVLRSWRPEEEDPLPELSAKLHKIQLPCYLYLCTHDPETKALVSAPELSDAAWVQLAEKGEELFLFGQKVKEENRKDLLAKNIPALLTFILRHMNESRSFSPQPGRNGENCAYCPYVPCCKR